MLTCETPEVGWFALDALPPLPDFGLQRIKRATEGGRTWFDGLPEA